MGADRREGSTEARPPRALVELCGDASIILSQSGVITDWNAAAELLYGFTEAEVLGRPIADLDAPGFRSPVHAFADDSAVEHHEVVRRHKDGSVVRVDVTTMVIPASRLPAPERRIDLTPTDHTDHVSVSMVQLPVGAVAELPAIVARFALDGTVVFCTGRGLVQLGLDASDAIGVNLFDLADTESARLVTARILAGEEFRGPWQIGDSLWQVTCVPVRDEDGELHEIVATFVSVQAEHDYNEAVARSEARFRALVQRSSDLICVVDPSLTLTYVSASAIGLLEQDPAQLIGESVHSVVHPDDLDGFGGRLEALLSRGSNGGVDDEGADRYDLRVRHGDGTWRTFEFVYTDLLDDPAVTGIVANGRDVTERRDTERKLLYQATHDPLTHLANRTLFLEIVDRSLLTSGGAVIVFGIDRLKVINDSLGHAAGDDLLTTVAERFCDAAPAGSVVARLGGDTFVVAGPTIVNARNAQAAAENLLATLDRPVSLAGREISTTAHAGIAVGPVNSDAGTLVRNADAALHTAKARHDNRIALYDSHLGARATRQLDLEQSLPRAVDGDQLRLHLQPIVDLTDGVPVGVEALVRWQHPELGLIAPLDFISLAEDTDDIVAIGAWVLREGCRTLADWAAKGHDLRLAVNLSPRQLHDPMFLPNLSETLLHTGFPPNRLTLEVTESVLVEDGPAALHTLNTLRDLGIRLAIDDFGTGYSSLVYLRRLHVDALKIDQSFVDGLGRDPEAATIVGAIINLATSLGLDIVAEGVETEEQRQHLIDHACTYAQGYLFAKPLEADEFSRRYHTQA